MDYEPILDYTGIISRIRLVTGCKTQHELAEFLGISQSSISDAKKRESIPSDWLLTLWRKKGTNPDWVMTGQGSRGLQPINYLENRTPPTVYIKEVRPPEECSIEELIVEIVRRAIKL